MKGKVTLAIVIVAILIASSLVIYYLESGPGSNSSLSNPSLVYGFSSTIFYNDQAGYYGGSFLGWNTSGRVFNNETDSVSIHFPGSLSRQFEAISSRVNVSFDYSLEVTMVVRRQLNGVYGDLKYSNEHLVDTLPYTYTTSFDIDNGTAFTVRFEASTDSVAFLHSVKLWESVESP